MKKITSAEPESKSADIAEDNFEALRAIFPAAFTEGKIDFDVLRQLLGNAVHEDPEKYGLTWHGKRAARQLALTPSAGTLRPSADESKAWEATRHLMIEGDNLEVLKLLQKSYAGRIELIYIDPPYNTGTDFVYPDSFHDAVGHYMRVTGQVDADGVRASTNSESSGRFHTSWLNMIYPRLALARTLLAENGSIFVSIDDGEVERLRAVMAEVFGEENFLAQIAWQSLDTIKNDAPLFSDNHEYIVGFARSKPSVRMAGMKKGEKQRRTYKNRDDDPRGDYLLTPLHAKSGTEAGRYTYTFKNGQQWSPPPGTYPRYAKSTLASLEDEGRLYLDPEGVKAPQRKTYWSEVGDRMPASTFWNYETFGSTRQSNKELADLVGKGVFQNPKPSKLIRSLIDIMGVDEGIVLDFFAGSGTTGQAVLDRNAAEGTKTQFVLVQLPETIDPDARSQREAAELCLELGVPLNIAELTKHRLRRVIDRLEVDDGAGFRVFKLDSSNIAAWDPDGDDLDGSLLDSLEHIKEGRSETDILFELVLKLGLELTVTIETREIGGVAVHSVGAGTLIACLVDKIGDGEVQDVALGIADWHRELGPVGETTVLFRDDAFASDVAKTNMTAILEQRGLATVRSL